MLSHRGRAGLAGLIAVVGVLAFLYVSGRLDPLLYRFGLNHNPCTHTLSGSIVCGADITGTPFGTNEAGGGGAGPSGNPVNSAGAVGKATNGSASHSAGSVP